MTEDETNKEIEETEQFVCKYAGEVASKMQDVVKDMDCALLKKCMLIEFVAMKFLVATVSTNLQFFEVSEKKIDEWLKLSCERLISEVRANLAEYKETVHL